MLPHPVHSPQSTTANVTSLIRSLLCRRYLVLFVLLTAFAMLYNSHQSANAQSAIHGTNPNGTIPPGGTLPPPLPDATQGQVRVLHLAPIATDLSATAVDICTEGGTPIAGLTGLVYLDSSGYLSFAPGTYDWFVGSPGCATTLLDLSPFVLGPGSVSTLLIVGGAAGQPLGSVLLVDTLGQINRLYLPIVYVQ
jgi:hypothetical protein